MLPPNTIQRANTNQGTPAQHATPQRQSSRTCGSAPSRQGESGLGLEEQRKAVEDFLNGGNWQLVEEYVEVESGKHDTPRNL